MSMARNLLKTGFAVSAYNRTRAKDEPLANEGATVAGTPAEAAKDADVVLSMVPDDAGIAQGMDRAEWRV